MGNLNFEGKAMTPQQTALRDATLALGGLEAMNVQIAVVQAAVRALIATHPERDQFIAYFDQAVSKLLTGPFIGGHPEKAILLRHIHEVIASPVTPAEEN